MTDPDYLEVLNDLCTISRATTAGDDEGGQPILLDPWPDLATGVRCRFETTSGVEIVEGKKVTIEQVNVLLPDGQDVTEKDRIINEADGATYSISLVRVAYEEQDEHHREAQVDLITSGKVT